MNKAYRIAARFSHLITATYDSYRYPILTSYGSVDDKIYRDVQIIQRKKNESNFSINLAGKKSQALLTRDSRFNQQLLHYSRGIKALEENDPVNMIREFYQVFNEENMHRRIKRYKPLRDVLNHPRITNAKTKARLLENFPYLEFDFRPSKVHIDTTSANNFRYLLQIADDLRYEAECYMWKII